MCDNGIVIMFKKECSAFKELYITRNEKKKSLKKMKPNGLLTEQ